MAMEEGKGTITR